VPVLYEYHTTMNPSRPYNAMLSLGKEASYRNCLLALQWVDNS